MDVVDLQRYVRGFVAAHGLEASAEVRLLDLLSELGELAKEALKGSEYGRRAFVPTTDWQDELGDALFSLFCLANESGVDVEQALRGALQKYEPRLAARDDAGSGR